MIDKSIPQNRLLQFFLCEILIDLHIKKQQDCEKIFLDFSDKKTSKMKRNEVKKYCFEVFEMKEVSNFIYSRKYLLTTGNRRSKIKFRIEKNLHVKPG